MKHTVWTITRDHNADEDAPMGSFANAETLCGPRDAAKHFAHDWNNGSAGSAMLHTMIATHLQAKEFQIYDDDGELYYEGRILIGDEPGAEFIPLDNFATPNAGATEIRIDGKKI